jgi:hypothetical protein
MPKADEIPSGSESVPTTRRSLFLRSSPSVTISMYCAPILIKSVGRPLSVPPQYQSDCENRASRNSPSLAVALNCGMGSSCLNADVNALERLQIVRGRKSSYSGSK